MTSLHGATAQKTAILKLTYTWTFSYVSFLAKKHNVWKLVLLLLSYKRIKPDSLGLLEGPKLSLGIAMYFYNFIISLISIC
jgi:hypothetical protein